MGRTSLVGAFGVGRQSAKDAVASTISYMPATSVGLVMNQNPQALPPEVGGDYFLRDSYKASVSGGGDVSKIIRPNSFGHTLLALTGQDTVTPVSGQTGAYAHAFTPFLPSPGVDLPWYTLIKDVAKIQDAAGTNGLVEQHLNSKLRSLSVDIAKSAIVTSQESWISTTPSTVTTASLNTETQDSSPKFQTCLASVSLLQQGGATITANAAKVERFALTYTNQLSEDQSIVGSFYLDDITLLQRTVTVDMDFVVKDAALYQAVYLNGGAIPSAWSPQIYRGALGITLNSLSMIGATAQPYQLQFVFPGLDFMMMPITLSGADLVRATISTQVTLGPSGADRFTVNLINGVAAY